MFKKKYIFSLLCVSVLLTGTFVRSQNSVNDKQAVFKWKVVSVYPGNFPIFSNGIEKFAKDVKAESNGQLDIKVYAAREHIGDINKSIDPHGVFDAVSQGTVEMGFGAPIYWTEEVPGCEFMYAVPFGLDEKGMHAWLYKGGGLVLLNELFKSHNILSIPMGNAGEAMGGWFDRKIEKIEDFNGMHIRMSGFCAKVYGKLGAKRNWMIATEALDAFIKGDINGAVCQGPYHDQFYRFYRAVKYYYYPGWQEPGGVLALIINKKAWGSLPANLQKKIKSVSDKTYHYIHNQFESMNSKYIKILKEDKRVELIEFPPEVLDRLEQLSREVLEEEAKKNSQFKRVYEAFKKFKNENKKYGWRGNLYGTVGNKKKH